ncbi:hypothetical protein [Actinomadura sp. 6N118]|uniref:hypothetical protein n=1 Tax=Actinomadura sp. 6N118 TaxID=3375151 RepID=UPI0037BC3280
MADIGRTLFTFTSLLPAGLACDSFAKRVSGFSIDGAGGSDACSMVNIGMVREAMSGLTHRQTFVTLSGGPFNSAQLRRRDAAQNFW